MIQFVFLGVPVRICPSFWIFMLFFSNLLESPSLTGVLACLVLFISLLVHEYGHALTARRFGADPMITLRAFGGEAQYYGRGISPKQEFFITLSGPLFEAGLAALSYVLLQLDFITGYPLRYFLHMMVRFNILWVSLNLIPVEPLDGGRLLRYFLMRKWDESKAQKISSVIALGAIAVAIPCLLLLHFFFFAVMLGFFAFQHFLVLKTWMSSRKSPFQQYQEGLAAIQNQDPLRAKKVLVKLLKEKDLYIRNLAAEAMAKIYDQENNEQKAYELLSKTDPQSLWSGKCLLCKLAFKQGNYELVATYAYEIYECEPSYEIALLNSKAFAALNRKEEAAAWLHTAEQFSQSEILNPYTERDSKVGR